MLYSLSYVNPRFYNVTVSIAAFPLCGKQVGKVVTKNRWIETFYWLAFWLYVKMLVYVRHYFTTMCRTAISPAQILGRVPKIPAHARLPNLCACAPTIETIVALATSCRLVRQLLRSRSPN
jgi:hypothetical protein